MLGDKVGQQQIVGVQERYERPVGVRDTGPKRSVLPACRLMPNQLESDMRPIIMDKLLDFLHGIVGRMIVDDDTFEVRIGLTAYGLKTILYVF
jgi:hypothetical protein